MASVNMAVISGNLIADPKLKQSEKGTWYAFCRVAVWMSPTYTAFLDFQKFWRTYEEAEKDVSQWQKGNTLFIVGTLSNFSKKLTDGTKVNNCIVNARSVTVVRLSKKNMEAMLEEEEDLFKYEGSEEVDDEDAISF